MAGAVGLAVLVALIGLAVWLGSAAPADDPLAFLPADANLMAGLRLGDLGRQLPALGQAIERQMAGPASGVNVKDEFGIDGRDLVDQLTIALTADGTKITVVTRSRVPFDSRRVNARQQQGMTRTNLAGRWFFSIDGADKQCVVALERSGGKVKWQTDRKSRAAKTFSFSTPLLIDAVTSGPALTSRAVTWCRRLSSISSTLIPPVLSARFRTSATLSRP